MSGDEPAVYAERGREGESFSDLAAAVEWAGENGEEVSVRVDEIEFRTMPGPAFASNQLAQEAARRVRREVERFQAEHETVYDEPQRWYVAVVNPLPGDDRDAAKAALSGTDAVAEVRERVTFRGEPVWVVYVEALSMRAALTTVMDAARRAWEGRTLDMEGGCLHVGVVRLRSSSV